MAINLSSVKNCEVIFRHNDSVILSGKNPYLFRTDGTFVAKYKNIRNAYNMIFLPNNTVIMDGLVDRSFHYVSLDDGRIIWSLPKKGNRGVGPNQFAASKDGNIVYYVYRKEEHLYADRIDLEKRMYESFLISSDLRATYHCYCDAEDTLSLLQSYYVKDISPDGTDNSHNLVGILKWNSENDSSKWVHQWKKYPNSSSTERICDDDYILFNNFMVTSFKTGEAFSLIENSPPIQRAPGMFIIRAYDPVKFLLTVQFISSSSSTIIIDCKKREIVSHYMPITYGLYGGCLIDDEFWIGTSEGVIKRPFPHMDPFPRKL